MLALFLASESFHVMLLTGERQGQYFDVTLRSE
jgi:hypothetical protein